MLAQVFYFSVNQTVTVLIYFFFFFLFFGGVGYGEEKICVVAIPHIISQTRYVKNDNYFRVSSLSQLNTSIFWGSLKTNSLILLSRDQTNLEVLYILNQHFQQELEHNTYLLFDTYLS